MTQDLIHLKEGYEALARKHSLPSFAELNEDFELERITLESATLLRLVRKTMMDKILNTLSFLELFLNPVNVPRLYMPYIRVMNAEDRKLIETLYAPLSTVSLKALTLDVEYNEKGEAIVIKDIYRTWNELKPSLKTLMQKISSPAAAASKRERSYFG
ncbi:MAG TPA: hypothetical protein VJK03_03315 [Candidatus Nanoarchaeia archaeon]|nr:hypothetical protein [Candidatus Nanoarchaeia archaeon]